MWQKSGRARVTTLSKLPLSFFFRILSAEYFLFTHLQHPSTHDGTPATQSNPPQTTKLRADFLPAPRRRARRHRAAHEERAFPALTTIWNQPTKVKSVVPTRSGPIYPIYLERDYLGVLLLHALFSTSSRSGATVEGGQHPRTTQNSSVSSRARDSRSRE